MCGIAGIIDIQGREAPPSLEMLRSMAGLLAHRGPDSSGLYRDRHASLVHMRLSIIDLSTGQQPLSNEDGTLWIVFNGEIFNYVELRYQLSRMGHCFRTHSDTEVVLHAYQQWGAAAFPRFNGQWALAIWNSAERKLVVSRDRLGVRPLYLHRGKGGVIRFASEVKALFADPEVPREIDPRGLDQTFTYWAPVPPLTPFRGIEEFPPASYRIYGPDAQAIEGRYWTPSYPEVREATISLADATEDLRVKLAHATQMRMLRADVPVGSYLSGGLDSSVIARLGREAKGQGEFRTFSVRFEDSEFDETPYQRAMTATLDSRHEELVVTRADIARVFPEVIWHAERPLLRTAAAPLFLLSRLVRQSGIKAVLTGEGADEMLAGYDLFREAKIRSFWSRLPESRLRPRLFERLYPYLARAPQHARGMALEFWKQGLAEAGAPGFSHFPRWRTTAMLKKFFSPEVKNSLQANRAPGLLENLPASFSKWDELAQAQYLESVSLLSGYLLSSQGDRMLMAHSVEGRFPFLDSDVVDFCNALPSLFKLPGLNEKNILKRMARGLVPESILKRPKQPYRAPDAVSFLAAGMPGYVADAFSEPALEQSGLFDPLSVRMLFHKCVRSSRGDAQVPALSNVDNMAFVGILSTQLLWQQFVQKPGAAPSASKVEFSLSIDRTNPS
ncbi:asparagine synthase (glutamine-hydrolyzing) [bacterium]|nr:MAG: asparagine synthase (glutamine-hydrolyzing) [bacterium]